MDVMGIAASLISGRNEVAGGQVQTTLLRKALDTQSTLMNKLMAPMALPLATDGRVGTQVNAYL